MSRLYYYISALLLFVNCDFTFAQSSKNESLSLDVVPIQHASFILHWNDYIIINDPVGDAIDYTKLGNPDFILVSDIHGDHFSVETLEQFEGEFKLITCQAVFEKLPNDLQKKSIVLKNHEKVSLNSIEIEALAMYNLAEEKQNFHPKGRGNGFILTHENFKIYISGDTEDIPEMRSLKDIDLAFICMNLPYTMHYKQAADAVLTFQPKKVIPYHYRGRINGETVFSDVADFKKIVQEQNSIIQVELLDWY